MEHLACRSFCRVLLRPLSGRAACHSHTSWTDCTVQTDACVHARSRSRMMQQAPSATRVWLACHRLPQEGFLRPQKPTPRPPAYEPIKTTRSPFFFAITAHG